MSLFEDLEQSGSIHLPNDSDSTKITTFDWNTADYAITINVIRMRPEEQIIFEQEQARYHANVDGTNSGYLDRGVGIKVGSDKYIVTNIKANKLFDEVSIRLRKLND